MEIEGQTATTTTETATKDATQEQSPASPENGPDQGVSPKTDEGGEDISRRYAALARRERLIMQKEAAFKEQLRSDPDYLEFQKFKRVRESGNYNEKLSFLGTDYNQITRALLDEKDQPPKDPVMSLQEEFQAFKKSLEEEKLTAQEQEHQRIEKAAKARIQQEIATDPDKFELVHLNEAYDMVYDVIKEWYLKHNEILPTLRAAQLVEEHFENELSNERFLNSKKLRAKFAPQPTEDKAPEGNQAAADGRKIQAPKTISSRVVAQGASVSDTRHFLDDEASKRRVAEKLQSGAYKRG